MTVIMSPPGAGGAALPDADLALDNGGGPVQIPSFVGRIPAGGVMTGKKTLLAATVAPLVFAAVTVAAGTVHHDLGSASIRRDTASRRSTE
jgi:hypothetical protein